MKRVFVLIANKAVTKPFNLNDLAGSAGRMDIVCRFISQSLFISHGVRKNSEVYVILKGEPDPLKTLKIIGSEVRYLAPDERNIGGMIKKALKEGVDKKWKKVSHGVYISRKGLVELLEELGGNFYYLREDGKDITTVHISDPVFILGDHLGVSEEDERVIMKKAEKISLGKISYQADQCVTILNYILDKRLNNSQREIT
uniref:tRNA (pseudouridine(54)-N(1))-methyltransferase n=1 Tax=Geoglobus ahangari TaxID=113653 RepID=A0A7C3YLN7_9EURY